MPTAYSRVTLVHDARRIDLALPGALPLADVMPQLLRLTAPPEQPEQPAAWSVGRIGGPSFPPDSSLHDEGVGDGEVLELRAAAATVHPAYVEDVRDAVEDAVEESGRQWEHATTVGFALLVALVVGAAALVLPEARRPRDPAVLGLAVVLAGLGVLGAWWAARGGHRWPARGLLAGAAAWGAVTGWLLSTWPDWPPGVALGAATAGALLVTGLARVATRVATAQLAGLAVVAGAALPTAGLVLAGFDPLVAARLDAVAAVLVVGVLPRVSLTVGGLAADDYRVRTFGLVTAAQLAERITGSAALLQGAVVGTAAVGGAAGLALTLAGTGWDRWLAAVAGLALVLRSRVFSRVPHVVPLRVAGLIVLAGQGLLLARAGLSGAGLVAVPVAGPAALVAVSALRPSEVTRARLKQVLNVIEAVAVVALIAVAVGALGGYDAVDRATG